MCVFLAAGAIGVVRWLERRGGAWSLGGAGLALGAAIGLKPCAVLFAGALGVIVIVAAARRRDAAEAIRSIGAYVAGGLAVPVALGTWLALAGGLRAWVDVIFGYDGSAGFRWRSRPSARSSRRSSRGGPMRVISSPRSDSRTAS